MPRLLLYFLPVQLIHLLQSGLEVLWHRQTRPRPLLRKGLWVRLLLVQLVLSDLLDLVLPLDLWRHQLHSAREGQGFLVILVDPLDRSYLPFQNKGFPIR